MGWLEGFDELMCRCGLESNGAPDLAANGVYGSARMGPIFGGMLLSGKRAANLILECLKR